MTPKEYKERLDQGETLFLLDVREPDEFKLANLGGTLIPLGDLPSRLEEIPQDQTVVVMCHHGVRSAHAVGFLRQSGFTNVMNLAGGIERWSVEIDPSVPRY